VENAGQSAISMTRHGDKVYIFNSNTNATLKKIQRLKDFWEGIGCEGLQIYINTKDFSHPMKFVYSKKRQFFLTV
jgi:hypothetical protein